MKTTKRPNDRRYPYEVEMNGHRILIPQQKEFGTFCRNHGCSVTACSIALQCIGKNQSDGTVWNPKEVYQRAKKSLGGFNNNKLTIWGCKSIINKIAGHEVAFWRANPGNKDTQIRETITRELRAGHVVIFEEKNPIHTVIFLGIDVTGKWITATNGRITKRSPSAEARRGLHGMAGAANQKNWWSGKAHGSGYVIVKGGK